MNMIMNTRFTIAVIATSTIFSTTSFAHPPQCPQTTAGLAANMLRSNIARGQGIGHSGAVTSYIELGIFQQSLLESIETTTNTTDRTQWTSYLQESLASTLPLLSNATQNAGLPLDRFSIGTALIAGHSLYNNESYVPAIQALVESVQLQPRNANNGLWYYNNRANLSAYHNLSYADGMYSYPSFAIVAASDADCKGDGTNIGAAPALEQVQLIYDICKRPDGLVVHGYDASKAHSWANPETGASPLVWGRALGWYTIGILRALSLLPFQSEAFAGLKGIFNDIVRAQIAASERSLQATGSHGVWQVVDQPGAKIDGLENFVEASASAMTVYALLRGVRTGVIEDQVVREKAVAMGLGIYQNLIHEFVIDNGNGTLSYNGTSSVASLSGNVSFEYYVTRPTVLNSLIGSSAFILAALEVEKVC